MESSPSALLKLLVPKTPFILKTAVAHTLSLSSTSSKWDLRTEITVKFLRDMLGPKNKPWSITKSQRLTIKDPGVKGKVWVSKVRFNCGGEGEDDVRQLLFKAVEDMCTGAREERETWTKPEARPLEAEWTGYRAGVSDNEPEPANLSKKEKYDNLMKETSSKVTVMYFHGGAMYLLDPAAYRPIVGRIAKENGGRVFNVRYRLSPQNPFPAALLDAFTAYLGLLHPPEGSPHEPVPANDIVFSGDSAGGILCTALLQLLLQFHRSNPDPTSLPKVKWYGKDVEIPLPAGLALVSPWLDTTRSLPSIENFAKYDYLPTPTQTRGVRFPPCEAWPAKPPRADLFSDGSAMCHPFVSPIMAKDWTNAPPVFFSVGQEMLRDEAAVLARRLHSQGVKVAWREFEAMPHVFAVILEVNPASRVHYEEYARFCREAVEGKVGQSSGEFVLAKSLRREAVDVGSVTGLGDEEVERLCREGMGEIIRRHGDAAQEAKPML
ncbi:acetyl-hydrolase [Byssothecium circinans]|uniref:Acetyl-hydrolase n=1 Tax=Byssothecium circinans TaxID=147558 RepID=A0A6A5U4X6_9PLEO|nr:acetyl-hydrolase [Byssothecium circinans]